MGLPAHACTGPIHKIIQGKEDNFSPPSKPAMPSPRLLANRVAVAYRRFHYRRFDEDGEDRLFLTSLLLPTRKICHAEFEIRVRRHASGGLSYDFNDYLLIGFAPFAESGDRKVLFQGGVWVGDPPQLLAKTIRIHLPAVELNRFVLLTESPHYLDIMLHDDTTVDYVKLLVRFE